METHDFRNCYVFSIAGLSGATVSPVLVEKAATKDRCVSMMNIVQFVKTELHAGMNIKTKIIIFKKFYLFRNKLNSYMYTILYIDLY